MSDAGGYGGSGNPYDGASGCSLDGQPVPCSFAMGFVNAGAAGICPDNRCRPGMRLTDYGWDYGDSGLGGGGIAYGVVDARTGAGWQKRSTPRQRRNDQRPTRRRQPRQNPLQRHASDRQLTDQECDDKLSSIFGGYAKAIEKSDLKAPEGRGAKGHSATARNYLPATVYDPVDNVTRRRADRGGIIHTYTDKQGSQRTDVKLYAPEGWTGDPVPYFEGGNSGLIFNYAGGITIEFVHVGTTNPNKKPSVPMGPANDDGLVEIGYVGGHGGEGANYYHTHIVFFSNKAKNERIDPRVLFCGFPAK